MKRRLRLGLAALLSLVAACVFIAAASAQGNQPGMPAGPTGVGTVNRPAFDPQETNVASLAWRGEELRFAKCDAAIPGGILVLDSLFFGANRANFFVEDFSGDPHYAPQGVPGTFRFYTRGALNCVSGDFISTKPGLAMIKLIVTNGLGQKVVEHQFLAGWMAIGAATLTELTGDTNFDPGETPGNLARVLVNGVIPINDEFRVDWGLTGGACPGNVSTVAIPGDVTCLTMPHDWATLAQQIASTSAALRRANPSIAPSQYWDIHDSSGPAEIGGENGTPHVHVPGLCAGTSTTIDQVDNCIGGGETGVFSRVFGDGTNPTIGPFDPQFPNNTLLSDGNLNALDAPMPPLRIDFTSTGNVGFLDDASSDKHVLYSRNGLGSSTAHNLYAPFYAAYIPATARNPALASGTNGPPGNNFEGYLVNGLYHFWDIADVIVNAEGGNSTCLLRNTPQGPIFRQLLSGPQTAASYTDEHGEAVIEWLPGVGNDVFGEVGVDVNGACDVEGIDLGGATITALARYPYQNVALPVPVAGSIAKTVNNNFEKRVECRLKDNGPRGGLVYICTATAIDVDNNGAIFNGELVCISTEPGRQIYPFPRGSSLGRTNELCVPLTGGGPGVPASGSVEFSATLVGSQVDVAAYFQDELIWRDTCITVGQEPSTQGPCGTVTIPTPGTGTVTPPGGSGTDATTVRVVSPQNSTTSIQGATQTVQTNNSTKAIKASVVSVKTVKVRNGRALVVKVQSPNKKATIRITLVGKNGKVLGRAVRTIAANKAVRVQRLLVPKAVRSVHVSVLR